MDLLTMLEDLLRSQKLEDHTPIRHWTDAECRDFVQALMEFGDRDTLTAKKIGKTAKQVHSHKQKFLLKLEKQYSLGRRATGRDLEELTECVLRPLEDKLGPDCGFLISPERAFAVYVTAYKNADFTIQYLLSKQKESRK